MANKIKNKAILIITDGIGYKEETRYNAFYHAKKPTYDYLFSHVPHSLLSTYGHSVGLPESQMGNSEVGHMCIGSGRVLYQDLVRINNAIEDGSIESNRVLCEILDSTDVVHLMILASDGGVHSHINHLKALAKIASKRKKKVWLHLISDGRDVRPQSFLGYYDALCESLRNDGIECGFKDKSNELLGSQKTLEDSEGFIKIATLSGRFYAMDRDNRWERVKLAFDTIVYARNPQVCDVREYVEKSYADGIYDEFIIPASFNGYKGMPIDNPKKSMNTHYKSCNHQSIEEGFIFINYRSDRARQIIIALGLEDFSAFDRAKSEDSQNEQKSQENKNLDSHNTKNNNQNPRPCIKIACMCEYDEKFTFPILFPKDKVKNTLAQVIAQNGLSQAHIAETEKYAHVTVFFNGGKEEMLEGEERLLVPSPQVRTYDLKPEMSAKKVGEGVCDFIKKGIDFIVVNFANGDMVGHTGNFEASIKAVEAVDKELGKIWKLAKQHGYSIVLTSDHGNCEEMKDQSEKPLPNHTVGDVFCFIDSVGVSKINDGSLNNVAPSILKIMGLSLPDEMDEALF